jgi:hypothetical protein
VSYREALSGIPGRKGHFHEATGGSFRHLNDRFAFCFLSFVFLWSRCLIFTLAGGKNLLAGLKEATGSIHLL